MCKSKFGLCCLSSRGFLAALVAGAFLVLAQRCVIAAEGCGGDPDSGRVTLQLSRRHQFLFAGYYMAKEKGYYREAGFDVALREKGEGEDVVSLVVSGQAQFGVGNASLVADLLQGAPVMVMAAMMQHSPFVIVAPKRSGACSLKDLAGQRILVSDGKLKYEALAMLAAQGVPGCQFEVRPRDEFADALSSGAAAACVGYVTDEPFTLQASGVPCAVFQPRDFGVDMYGEFLFTSRQMAQAQSEAVRAFRSASLRGWRYALEHTDETIDHVTKAYAPRADRRRLEYEAQALAGLMDADLIDLGYVGQTRWRRVVAQIGKVSGASAGAEAGLLESDVLFMQYLRRHRLEWRYAMMALLVGAVGVIILFGGLSGVLGRIVTRRTASLREMNRRLEVEIAERDQAEFLIRMQRDVAVSLCEASTLQACLEQTAELLLRVPGVDASGIYRVDPSSGELRLAAWRGISDAYASAFAVYREDFPHGSEILAGQKVCLNSDAIRQVGGPATLQEGLEAVIVVPVRLGSRLLASVHVASLSVAEFSPNTMAAVEAVASLMGSVLIRFQAQEKEARTRANLEAFVEALDDVVLICALDGGLLHANPSACVRTGYSFGELREMNIGQMHAGGPAARASEFWDGVVSGRQMTFDLPLRRKDGSAFPTEIKFVRGVWDGQAACFGVARDLTERLQAEGKLRQSEALFKSVAEGAFSAISLSDAEGRFIYVNPRMVQLTGYAADELVGASHKNLFHPDGRALAVSGCGGVAAGACSKYWREASVCRKDGQSVPVDVTVQEMEWEGLRAFVVMLKDVSERKRLEQEILKVAEWERVSIGQELHDSIGQQITAMSYLMEALTNSLRRDGAKQTECAAEIMECCRAAHSHLRNVVQGLLPLKDDEPLAEGLRRLAGGVEEQLGVRCTVSDECGVAGLHHLSRGYLYRIAQEAVTNAVRHGKAREVRVMLGQDGPQGELRIDDDGQGFCVDPATVGGSGIRIMRYRADIIGGQLSVLPGETRGVTVRCTFPCGLSLDTNKEDEDDG